MRQASCIVGVSALLVSISPSAYGEVESITTLSLNWMRFAGAESCLDAGRLARSVEASLGRPVFVAPSTASRNIEGWIEPARPGWHVALRASDADGHPIGRRELATTDENCGSIERSIILAVGLLAEAAQGAQAPLVQPAPSSPASTLETPVAPPSAAPPNATSMGVPAPLTGDKAQAAEIAPRTIGQTEVGPTLNIGWGVLPDTAVGVGLRATISAHRSWMIDFSSDLWVPQDVRRNDGGTASFSRTDLALGACFMPWQAQIARLGACLGASGGLLIAHGNGTKSSDSVQLPSLAGYGRIIGLVRLFHPLWITGSAALTVPTTDSTFYHRGYDGSAIDVWRMPVVSGSGQIGLMLHFGS